MGFYGNITNTSKTTFQFDKIYPNKLSMDANVNNDGIFIGRYVLVEYDQDAAYPIIYTKDGINFYSSPNTTEEISRIKFKSGKRPNSEVQSEDVFYLGEIGQVQDITYNQDGTIKNIEINFYQCSNEENDQDGVNAIFSLLTKTSSNNIYINNFAIDEAYESWNEKFKGYDSTVWVKTTINANDGLITKYVNIADLNSVVPTFDIAADAPTMNPITPHFDADSTNVYYKLHMQSPYGFRVAASEGKSDEQITWTTTTYNKETDTTTIETTEPFAGDIYYNKAGFNPEVVSKVSGDNYIKLAPTAKSGAIYSHGQEENDIQEFRLHLPAIGNMMSDAWDIIHGPNRDDARTDENSSLQGRLDSFKFMADNQIPVKRAIDGTLVGTNINGNTNREITDIKTESLHINDKTKDDAWIRTEINTNALLDEDGNEVSNNGISIHHTFTATADTTSISNKNTDYVQSSNNFDKIELYTPIVDAAGHVVGKNTETVTLPYGFKHIIINGQSTEISNPTVNTETVTADNTQDQLVFASSNKWIRMSGSNDHGDNEVDVIRFGHEVHTIDQSSAGHTNLNEETGAKQEDNLTIYDWNFDDAGHITEKKSHTYTLPFSFKTIKVTNDTTANTPASTIKAAGQIADTTQDILTFSASNKWIKLDNNTEDTVKMGHLLKTVSPSTSVQDLSSETSTSITFNVYNDSFDEAGHHSGRDTKTITMPFGYGKITGDTGSTSASATFDTLAINANDAWIATNVSQDKVNITHTDPVVSAVTAINDIDTPQFGSKFTIEDWHFDEKGHKHSRGTHTIQFPEGSLNNLTATSSSVLTGISMNTKTGAITQTNANVGTLALTGYSDDTDTNGKTLQISSASSINTAFKTIQNYINNLDYTNESAIKFISKITQIDGKIAVERAAAGTLTLGTASADGTISSDSSLNDAFNITNSRIKAEEEALAKEVQDRKDAIDALTGTKNYSTYFDTMKEIADWLDANKDGVVDITLDIVKNTEAIQQLNSDDTVSGSVANSIKTKIEELELGSAAFTESSVYATAEQGNLANSAIQPTTEFIYQEEIAETDEETGETIIIPAEKITINGLIAKIKDLEAEILLLKGYHTSIT